MNERQRYEQMRADRSPRSARGLGFLKDWFERQILANQKALAGMAEAWASVAPPEWRTKVRLEALRHGTLEMSVESEAERFQLELLLRGGLQTKLMTACRGKAIKGVRVRVIPPQKFRR